MPENQSCLELRQDMEKIYNPIELSPSGPKKIGADQLIGSVCLGCWAYGLLFQESLYRYVLVSGIWNDMSNGHMLEIFQLT